MSRPADHRAREGEPAEEGAGLFVIELDTPGGLLQPMEQMVQALLAAAKVPPELAAIAMKCLRKDRAQRCAPGSLDMTGRRQAQPVAEAEGGRQAQRRRIEPGQSLA